ncbi:MAG: hypothetical protein A2X18_07230 [Bacteroidetes bacterium GWF2_40_14]|nr:MAG: hypothetical protein A2X18_07230 [Bacteroidetes bacterium GWF2_40_14]
MRSKVADRILAKTPKDVEIFIRLHADITVRVNQLLKEKGYNQKQLAAKLDKSPSEINKWLKGDHNFTLKSIAKLQAELGDIILYVPKRKAFSNAGTQCANFTVYHNEPVNTNVQFHKFETHKVISNNPLQKNAI